MSTNNIVPLTPPKKDKSIIAQDYILTWMCARYEAREAIKKSLDGLMVIKIGQGFFSPEAAAAMISNELFRMALASNGGRA